MNTVRKTMQKRSQSPVFAKCWLMIDRQWITVVTFRMVRKLEVGKRKRRKEPGAFRWKVQQGTLIDTIPTTANEQAVKILP